MRGRLCLAVSCLSLQNASADCGYEDLQCFDFPGVYALHGGRGQVCSARQQFTVSVARLVHTAHGVENPSIHVRQHDVTEPPCDLRDEELVLRRVGIGPPLNLNAENPVQPQLAHGHDSSARQVFAQKHCERSGLRERCRRGGG